jgi:hypothetical protein
VDWHLECSTWNDGDFSSTLLSFVDWQSDCSTWNNGDFLVCPAFLCGLVIGMFHVEQFGKPLIPGKDAGAAGPVPRHDAPI